MPDIALRFNKDVLVLSAPIEASLQRQGVNVERDLELLHVLEPEALADALRLQELAGAQCLVSTTSTFTPARLAAKGMDGKGAELAEQSLSIVRGLAPQHVLVEVGPCQLPLDGSDKNSLNEHRDQYARAARACQGQAFDAFLLAEFVDATDMKCALMGIRQVSDAPVLACVRVDAAGTLANGKDVLEDALQMMAEYGADAVGFSTAAPQVEAVALARRAAACADLPLLVQLDVAQVNPRQREATPGNPYYCADVMSQAALALRAAGVQFLRAGGAATPAYTGALAATTDGLDVVPSQGRA